jgi:hypothetical protein
LILQQLAVAQTLFLFRFQGAIMNAVNQFANEVFVFDAISSTEQPMLILDALDLAAVGGGADIVLV